MGIRCNRWVHKFMGKVHEPSQLRVSTLKLLGPALSLQFMVDVLIVTELGGTLGVQAVGVGIPRIVDDLTALLPLLNQVTAGEV